MKTKNNILMILGIIMIVFSTVSSVYATSYLYNADEVSYTPASGSSITSTNVQGAIDDLYTLATNYNTLKTRTDTLKNNYVGQHATTGGTNETFYCFGLVSSGQTLLRIGCLAAFPNKVSTITPTSIILQLRPTVGNTYVQASGFEAVSYKTTISYLQQQGIIYIDFIKSDKWSNVTNNTNVGGWITMTYTTS